VVAQTPQRTRAILDEQVTLADGLTWGVRFGFWVELALTLCALALVLRAYLGRRFGAGRLRA
jgi:apolipoprotein N-acyltransferase